MEALYSDWILTGEDALPQKLSDLIAPTVFSFLQIFLAICACFPLYRCKNVKCLETMLGFRSRAFLVYVQCCINQG